jgi:hypothetical protein
MGASSGTDPWDSETVSKRWGPAGADDHISWLTKSATVSVAAVNRGGDYIQPIGSTRGEPMICGCPGKVGSTTPSFGTSFALTQIR